MPGEFQYDVFLSHNHADKPRVRQLAERLKTAGVRVGVETRGRSRKDEGGSADSSFIFQTSSFAYAGLEQSRVLLLCLSPAALASGWVRGTLLPKLLSGEIQPKL